MNLSQTAGWLRLPIVWTVLASACVRGDDAPAGAPAPATTAGRDAALLKAAKDPAVVKQGRETFVALCQACHGDDKATGDAASNLFDAKWHHGARPAEIERTILQGLLEKGMPGWGEILPAEDTTAVTAFLLSQQKS